MRGPTPRAITVVAACLLSVTLASSVARADFRSSFRDGVRAFEEQRYEDAAAAFRRALAQKAADDSVRIAIGQRRISYIPNVMLALSLARLGRCEEALAHFEPAGREATDREAPLLQRQLREARDSCGRQIATTWIRETESSLADARAIADQISKVLSRPGVAKLLSDREGIEERARKSSEMVQNATSLLEAGKRSGWFLALRDARQAAATTQETLEALRTDIRVDLAKTISAFVDELESDLGATDRASAEARTAIEAISSRDKSRVADLEARFQTASQSLVDARASLARAREDRDPFQLSDPALEVRRLASSLTAIASDARALSKPATRDLPKVATVRDPTPKKSADAPPGTVPEVDSPATARLGQNRLTAATAGADSESETAPTASPSDQEDSNREESSITIDSATGLPEVLVDGVNAYFGGRYREALDLLSNPVLALGSGSPETSGPEARGPEAWETEAWEAEAGQSTRLPDRAAIAAQAALFRAAASFALYRLGGESDPRLLAGSRSELDAARAAQPGLRIDPDFFPPPFLELYSTAPERP